jgi:hypothetical protein
MTSELQWQLYRLSWLAVAAIDAILTILKGH